MTGRGGCVEPRLTAVALLGLFGRGAVFTLGVAPGTGHRP